jgi:hypothetical protein
LSPPDLLDLSKEANTSDKKLHAPKGSIAAWVAHLGAFR